MISHDIETGFVQNSLPYLSYNLQSALLYEKNQELSNEFVSRSFRLFYVAFVEHQTLSRYKKAYAAHNAQKRCNAVMMYLRSRWRCMFDY